MNVNWRNTSPEKIPWVLWAISLVNFPREFFLELLRRSASNKVKGAADEIRALRR
jgi:hypothetical protein